MGESFEHSHQNPGCVVFGKSMRAARCRRGGGHCGSRIDIPHRSGDVDNVRPRLVKETPAFPLCPSITASINGSSTTAAACQRMRKFAPGPPVVSARWITNSTEANAGSADGLSRYSLSCLPAAHSPAESELPWKSDVQHGRPR